MELIQDAQNIAQVRETLKLVAPFPVVWPTATDCQRALHDFTVYHLSHNLGLLDALIAGVCGGVVRDALYVQCEALPRCTRLDHHAAIYAVSDQEGWKKATAPLLIWAEPRTALDCLQRPLRSRFRQQVSASVRLPWKEEGRHEADVRR